MQQHQQQRCYKIMDINLQQSLILDEPRKEYQLNFESSNEDENKVIAVYTCRISHVKVIIFCFLSLLIFPLLICKWSIKCRRALLYSYCDLSQATHLFILHETNSEIIAINTVTLLNHEPNGASSRIRMVHYRFLPYYLNEELRKLLQVKFDYSSSYSNIHERYSKGICTEAEQVNAQTLFGKGIIEIPEKSTFAIFVDEILSPFYIFQIAAIILWMSDTYYLYAMAILIMTILSVTIQIKDTKKNLQNVKEMVACECEVDVFRGEFPGFVKCSCAKICPGDIIDVSQLSKIPCDCILLNGSCVIDEAMLTGESIPVQKTVLPVSSDVYNPDSDKKYTLYKEYFQQ